jgi:DNA (cytosine-5)-methyltransferase 1
MLGRPVILDLFCKAGGAGAGYHQAGFDVIGIDLEPQPNYPFPFYQEDALVVLTRMLQSAEPLKFAAIHASPPCQAFSAMRNMPDARTHPELVAPIRELLQAIGLPYVIENVVGAPLQNPMLLCGSMFGLQAEGFQLRRHRLFESNMNLMLPGPCAHTSPVIGVYGGHVRCRSTKFWRAGAADFPGYDKKRLAMTAMGVEHRMTMDELSEAIPPTYTEFIGAQLLQVLEVAA